MSTWTPLPPSKPKRLPLEVIHLNCRSWTGGGMQEDAHTSQHWNLGYSSVVFTPNNNGDDTDDGDDSSVASKGSTITIVTNLPLLVTLHYLVLLLPHLWYVL
jgi:hypothetical protein